MAISKIEFDGNTLIDLTSDTVTTDTLLQGYTAHSASGESVTGIRQTYTGVDICESSVKDTTGETYIDSLFFTTIKGNYAVSYTVRAVNLETISLQHTVYMNLIDADVISQYTTLEQYYQSIQPSFTGFYKVLNTKTMSPGERRVLYDTQTIGHAASQYVHKHFIVIGVLTKMNGDIYRHQIQDFGTPILDSEVISSTIYTGDTTFVPSTSDQIASVSMKANVSDITIKGDANLVAGNIASGVSIFGVTGTHAGQVVDSKVFDVTLASAITGAGTLVSGDATVAAHYTDSNAQITIRKVDNVLVDGVWCMTAGNTYYGTSYGVRCNSSSGAISSTPIIYSIAQEPTSAVSIGCNVNGDIKVRMSTTRNCLPAGTYKVIFSW